MTRGPQNITELLVGYGRGDKEALDQLMPLVYDELHRQAARYLRREQAGHTLQTTALIHEAYVRLWISETCNGKIALTSLASPRK